ncbi:zinc-binding metallopeptidase family protein [Paracoccus pacificus]|uniref:Zinc-binding metallopeptidase n=1 Tax=Paracoccus pacificus TaxID=1463598 RepID=A0ABW4RCL0_9RHOB
MQLLFCPICGTKAYFHNLICPCGADLYFDPEQGQFRTDGPACANRERIACNWVGERGLCRSCLMSPTIPPLSVEGNLELLAGAERGKRWVLANLARWGWFTDADADPGPRPQFLMLSERTGQQDDVRVMMGHQNGIITINVVEADDEIRFHRKNRLGERYRSMVGHFRHEIAHFLFERLEVTPGFLPAFRPVFGDETQDYGAALARHYAAPRDPGEEFITPYATAHPHEDWAETCAHFLHLVDMTDSFMASGLMAPQVPSKDYDAYADPDSTRLFQIASVVALAVNDINRALDNPDLYPFVLTPRIRQKLSFAHDWVTRPR